MSTLFNGGKPVFAKENQYCKKTLSKKVKTYLCYEM